MKHKKASASHEERLIEELRKDPEFAAEYLKASMEEEDPALFLVALRRVAEARGGMAKVAENAGIARESLYRVLSSKGNPRYRTLLTVIRAMNLHLSFSQESSAKAA